MGGGVNAALGCVGGVLSGGYCNTGG